MDKDTNHLLERVVANLEPARGLEDLRVRVRRRRVRVRLTAGITAGAVALTGVGGAIAILKAPANRSVSSSVSPTPRSSPAANGRISFVRVRSSTMLGEGSPGVADLYTVRPNGSRVSRIAENVSAASWSPDGMRIAYSGHGLWVASADGTESTKVYPWGYAPAWSPDGQRLAFYSDHSRAGGEGVWIIGADGSNPHLLSAGLSLGQLAWSPDGSQLAVSGYRTSPTSTPSILLLDAATGEIERTIEAPPPLQLGFGVSWSADGSRIAFDAFTAHIDPRAGIYLIDADGTNIVQVVQWSCSSNACVARTPAWSPNGKYLAFTATIGDRQGSDGSTGDMRILNIHTGRISVLTHGHLDCCPAWQPVATAGSMTDNPTETIAALQARVLSLRLRVKALQAHVDHDNHLAAIADQAGERSRVERILARVQGEFNRIAQTEARIRQLMDKIATLSDAIPAP